MFSIGGAVVFVSVMLLCLRVNGGNQPVIKHPTYNEIEAKFDALDKYTQAKFPQFKDRLYGIASLHLYSKRKTTFMYNILRNISDYPRPVVCELGFMAGHSATMFLEGLPNAIVYSFDLADNPWSEYNAEYMRNMYGSRFVNIFGDSAVTFPEFVKKNPNVKCDILLIDGSKDPVHRYNDILMFKTISVPNALLFLDEVNNVGCASGLIDIEDPHCHLGHPADSACSRTYNKLVKENILKVTSCVTTPKNHDNYCAATLA